MEKNICMGLMMIVSVFLWGTNIVQADAEFPQTYEIEDENVIFHTEIEVPLYFDSNQLRQSTADCMEIDGEGAFTYFAKGRETAESYEDSSTGEFYRKLTDGSSFSYIPSGYISYSSENMPHYFAAFRYYDNRASYAQETEFDFATREVCMEDFTKLIHEVGYGEVELNGNFYYLDYKTLQAEEQHENPASGEIDTSKNKVSWTQEDSAYQFYANQQFQGLPVYHSILAVPDDDENGCLISGVYSTRGFENVNVVDIFKFHETEEGIELLPFEQCAKRVSEKYKRILTESVFTVNRATLYQYIERDKKTKKNQKVIPIWYFDILEEGPDTKNPDEKILRRRTMLVNAVTGEEIVTE